MTQNKWTPNQIRAARRIELQPLLKKMGYPMQAMQNNNWKVYDLANEIIIKETYWYNPETGEGGNAIDLLTQIIGLSFNQAMDKLTAFI